MEEILKLYKEKEPELFSVFNSNNYPSISYFDINKFHKSTLIGEVFNVTRNTNWIAVSSHVNNKIRIHIFDLVSKKYNNIKNIITIDKNNNVLFQQKFNVGKMKKTDFIKKDTGFHEATHYDICSIDGNVLSVTTRSGISYLSSTIHNRTKWSLPDEYSLEDYNTFLERNKIFYVNRAKEFKEIWNEYLYDDLIGIRNLCGE